MCGKNHAIISPLTPSEGSPPRVREKPNMKFSSDCYDRITPACAGKTLPEQASYLHQRDHPRMCGKNKCIMFSWDSYTRITPACAGKTKALKSPLYYTQDHPRVCGKNTKNSDRNKALEGSPPRVREKLSFILNRVTDRGITPASAGKTMRL